jgi:8-oxo-dGTP diphosphatase
MVCADIFAYQSRTCYMQSTESSLRGMRTQDVLSVNAHMNTQKSVGIKVICFSVVDGKLSVFAPKGVLPSKSWEKGMILEREVAELIKKSSGLVVAGGYFEQLYTLSRPDEKDFDITVVYYFLIANHHIKNLLSWTRMIPAHDRTIISYAKQRLQWKIEYTNVVQNLLPAQFTFGELQSVYEAILERKLDKRNFRKKIISLRILKDTGKKKVLGRARPAEVYIFKDRTPSIVEIL